MSEISRNKLIVKLVDDAKKDRVRQKEYNVAGCVHPLRPQMTAKGQVPVGSTVEFAVQEACKSAGVSARLMKYGVAQIGTRDVEKGVTVWRPVMYKDWKKRKIADGELLRFRLLPKGGGGGGGKSPLRTILTVVVMVAAIVASVYTAGLAWGPMMGLTGAQVGTLMGGLAGLAVSTIGMVLVNAIAPIKTPSVSLGGLGNNRVAESQVYSASAGQNSVNQWGRVPVPLGRGRFAPPKAASPYTETVGEDQYLHELLCLGIGDMNIRDIKIGTTPIDDFNDVEYEIYTHNPINPTASQYYPTGKFQEDLNVQLEYNEWSSRTSAECNRLEVDFGFQGLAWYDDNGNPTRTSVEFSIQYKPYSENGWSNENAQTPGVYTASYTVSGAQSRLLRRTWKSPSLPRGRYDVRIKRVTPDSTNDRLKNESYWSALRSVTNDPPVATKYPVMLLALRIRATGQLSGSIQTLTHYYETKCLDYDDYLDGWFVRPTSNPASVFRYVLQNANAMARPQSDTLIDLQSLKEAHKYWSEKGWEYNYVCDADVSVFERLQAICASGLGSPTMNDGKWAIVIDKPRDNVVCAFTSANSWGWSFKRTQVRLPNAIHCTFINQKTWDTDMRVVPTDEPNTGQYIYETQDYEGVNNPSQVYQLARFHYADAKVRRRTITLRAYDEAIMCTRGDLVECACPSINPQGLQVGRVRKVTRDENDLVVSFTTDQIQTTDSGVRVFGVKVYQSDGTMAHAIVKAEGKSQRKITLQSPQAMAIAEGDKYAFGDYMEETFQAIVLSLKYNSDWTCDVTLQDYAPQLYGNLEEEIPEFKSVITKSLEQRFQIMSKPVIVNIATDESVLLQAEGALLPRILISYRHPNDLDSRAKFVSVEISDEGENKWRVVRRDVPLEESEVYCNDVEETKRYDIRMRYTGGYGETSEYAVRNSVLVIGKTTPPATVEDFSVEISKDEGLLFKWKPLSVLDLDKYRIFGAQEFYAVGSPFVGQVFRKTGELTFFIEAIDTGRRVSKIKSNDTVTILPPETPALNDVVAKNDGVHISWQDCSTTWPVASYRIEDEFTGTVINALTQEYLVSPRGEGTYSIKVQATDKFDNASAIGELVVDITPIEAPVVTTEIHDGVVRFSWEAPNSFFPIKTYRFSSVNGVLLQETDSTFFDVNGPAGTLEYRVQAVDVAGNESMQAEVYLALTSPESPIVEVNLNNTRDGLVISWNVPNSMLPIRTYDIVRQWDEVREYDGQIETKEYDYGSTDATFIESIAVSANEHTFMVRAVDSSGNKSAWGYLDFKVRASSSPFITDIQTIDNNVLMYWDEPQDQFFAIAYYNLFQIEDGYPMLLGRIDARFASRFEDEAGTYHYRVCPVDVAGNVGSCSTASARVSQPPDFVFYNDYDSLFNGKKENAILDGAGNLILPIDHDATWTENAYRIAEDLGKTRMEEGLLTWDEIPVGDSWEDKLGSSTSSDDWGKFSEKEVVDWEGLTWQEKIDKGYEYALSPFGDLSEGTYQEIVDIGDLIPSTNIHVTVTSTTLTGDPIISCKIEVSEDSETWRVMAEDALSTYATSFRYVRYTFTVKGGTMALSNINYRLDVKSQSEYGMVDSSAEDNGEGFISKTETPMLYGTWVGFHTAFSDIQSGPLVFCNEEGKTAYASFEDVVRPQGFRVYVLDKDGNRVSGKVSWSAHGV